MARAFDSFEIRCSRVGGEMAEMLEYAKRAGCGEEQYKLLLETAKTMNDTMRRVRIILRESNWDNPTSPNYVEYPGR